MAVLTQIVPARSGVAVDFNHVAKPSTAAWGYCYSALASVWRYCFPSRAETATGALSGATAEAAEDAG